MTITRELQSVTIQSFAREGATQRDLITDDRSHIVSNDYGHLTYSRASYDYVVDEYGQLMYATLTRTADVAFKLYSQQNVQDPRYTDVEAIGLTKDTSIVPGEVITFAQGDFRVKYVIPTGRWQELMLVKL